jgi:hypothetical protein
VAQTEIELKSDRDYLVSISTRLEAMSKTLDEFRSELTKAHERIDGLGRRVDTFKGALNATWGILTVLLGIGAIIAAWRGAKP